MIVTTPQDIALLDARKGLKMFEKVQVPVLGVIENMAVHVCSQCGHREHVFGSGGQPTVVKDPDGEVAQAFRAIARTVAAKLSLQARDYKQAFPSIVIQ